MALRVEHWAAAWGRLSEANMRRRLDEQGYRVSRYDYPPGTYFSEHTHDVDKKDTVLAGRLKIISGGFEITLAPGDMVEIPAGAPHTAEVVGSETVVSLDATRIVRR